MASLTRRAMGVASRAGCGVLRAARLGPGAHQALPGWAYQKGVTRALGPASFHNTAHRSLLPPLPQTVAGSVNDAAPVPPSSPSHGSYHWTFERLVAAGLVPLTLAPFAAGSLNPTLDAVLCGTLLVHCHLGIQAVIIDYLPTRRVPKTRKGVMWALNAATVLVGVGLYEFETNDVGLTEAVKRVWKA